MRVIATFDWIVGQIQHTCNTPATHCNTLQHAAMLQARVFMGVYASVARERVVYMCTVYVCQRGQCPPARTNETCTHTHTHTHTLTQTHTHHTPRAHVKDKKCTHRHRHTHTGTHPHTHAHTNTHTHHAHTHGHAFADAQAHTHASIHTRMRARTCTHARKKIRAKYLQSNKKHTHKVLNQHTHART